MDDKKWGLSVQGETRRWTRAVAGLSGDKQFFARAKFENGVWTYGVGEEVMRVAYIQTEEGAKAQALITAQKQLAAALLDVQEELDETLAS